MSRCVFCGKQLTPNEAGQSFRPPWAKEALQLCHADRERMKRAVTSGLEGLVTAGVSPQRIRQGYAVLRHGPGIVRSVRDLVRSLRQRS